MVQGHNELTPLSESEGQFLVHEAEGHDEDEVDAGGGETGDDAGLGTSPLVLEEGDGDEDPVHDDSDDEDQHQHHLQAKTQHVKLCTRHPSVLSDNGFVSLLKHFFSILLLITLDSYIILKY